MKIKEGGVMDIQKEKDLYLKELLEREVISKDEFDDIEYIPEVNSFHSNYLSVRFIEKIDFGWSAWQAKAQAVPEGFVLIKASDRDQEMLELIDQRDHMEGQAEELKDKLQALYGVDFGEHSSCNFPFQNAIDYDDSDLVLVERVHPDAIVHNQGLGLFKECQVIYGWAGKSKDFKDALNKGFYHGVKLGAKAVLETAMIEAQEPAND